MVKPVSTSFAIVLAAVSTTLTLGCVDARSSYDDFADRLVDAEPFQDVDGMVVTSLPDVTGQWLIAVWPINIPDDKIILFETELNLTGVTANTGKLDISAHPLSVADREPVGEPFEADDQPVGSDASFDATFIGTLPGAANPISGSPAGVDAVLLGELRSVDFVCGTLTGTAGTLTLDGSHWGAVRITGDTLPEPVFTCGD
jgi:hypothetical protein